MYSLVKYSDFNVTQFYCTHVSVILFVPISLLCADFHKTHTFTAFVQVSYIELHSDWAINAETATDPIFTKLILAQHCFIQSHIS